MQDFLSHSGILTIDLAALAANYRDFQTKAGAKCAVAGVVKADGYGVGMARVVETLSALDCPQFFVATVEEALALRQVNTQTPVAVLGGLYHGAEQDYIAHKITPVLNTPDDIARWQILALQGDTPLPAILHFDTGMNRLGLSRAEADVIIQDKSLMNGLDIQLVMSHFACADDKDHVLTKKQAHDFANIAQHFEGAQKSLANSSGLYRSDSYIHDMVRPGYALYGGNPTPESANPMQSVVSLNARILQIRNCKAGESIGYSATHKFDKDTRTATVAVGYADGFLRSHSSRIKDGKQSGATLYYNGQPCPVLGRVSMDLVSVDISAVKGDIHQGGSIEILGPNASIDDLAASAGTIGYEILTSLGARYKREYAGK